MNAALWKIKKCSSLMDCIVLQGLEIDYCLAPIKEKIKKRPRGKRGAYKKPGN